MARRHSVLTLGPSPDTRRSSTINASRMPVAMAPAWTVYAWAPVLWQAGAATELHLVHLGTGVAWDWIELRQGVVAMSDPLGVVTDLRLLDEHGEALTRTQVATQLHQLVHALPWQSEVERALRQLP